MFESAVDFRTMSGEVGPLKGREKEFKQLNDWVSKAIRNKQPTSIYISGLPGTGTFFF